MIIFHNIYIGETNIGLFVTVSIPAYVVYDFKAFDLFIVFTQHHIHQDVQNTLEQSGSLLAKMYQHKDSEWSKGSQTVRVFQK